MSNLALFADGAVLGLRCHILIEYRNNITVFTGTVEAEKNDIAYLLQNLGCNESTAKAITAEAPPVNIKWQSQNNQFFFIAQTVGFSLCAIKADASAFLLYIKTEIFKNCDNSLLTFAAQATQFLCIDELFLKFGTAPLPQKLIALIPAAPIPTLPQSFNASSMLLYSRFNLANANAFGEGMRLLLGIDEIDFICAQAETEFLAGLFISEISKGDITIKNLFCSVSRGGFEISGQLLFNKFSFILACRASLNAFVLSGYMPHGTELDLGGGWLITELALGIGYNNGISISLLGRIMARRLMLFAALSFSALPSAVTLNFLSAAASDLTLPNIVYSFTTSEISGVEAFGFIEITGFPLDGADLLTEAELNNSCEDLAHGFNRVMSKIGLELKGSYKITAFGNEKILTDNCCMRNYTIYPTGQIKLNPQFYFAPLNFSSFGGYEIKKGAFFCGVLKIFCVSVKLFFQTSDDGIIAYLNISPIKSGIFELTQSSFKANQGVIKPSGGSMVSQFLSNDTKGPELFICMSKSQKCFFIDARLLIWQMLEFDAHILYADKLVSIDAKFSFFNLFDVSFYLRTDYSSFNNLNFEFLLVADTSGLKRLVQGAINKIENAARCFNENMNGALSSVNEAQNSIHGLWGQISDFERRIQDCKNRINGAPWYKKWYIAIGAGFEIGAYEIAKAGIYIAIGVAQAALAVAEGILRLAQGVGNVVLSAVTGFLNGLISLFYIERLSLAGVASSKGAALGVKLSFIALGKSYSTEGVLSIGGGSAGCEGLLNEMVENETAEDINSLNNVSRSSKKAYRTASLDASRELYAEGADYCRRTKAYMRDLQCAYAREYGGTMAEGDEMLLAVDGAIASAKQSAELILNLTEKMNFQTAFEHIEKQINAKPESKLSRSRSRSLGNLKAQWQEVVSLKNNLRNESRQLNTQTAQGVFEAATAKTQSVLESINPRDVQSILSVNPDKMLNRAESLMYQKFSRSKSRFTFCPFNEPVLIDAIDGCKANSQPSENIMRKRSLHRKHWYKARL